MKKSGKILLIELAAVAVCAILLFMVVNEKSNPPAMLGRIV